MPDEQEFLPQWLKRPDLKEILKNLLEIQKTEETRFIPVPDWNKYHPWPPIGGLRHLIFYADLNGFHKVITRVGRRVLINEKKFFEYMEKQNVKSK